MADMEDMEYLRQVLIIIAAAVAIVPLFRRVGASAVLGYLVAGAIIGPHATGLITDLEGIEPLGELGVAFLLFSIGLELSPKRLWTLRAQVFGLGLAQVVLTAFVLWLLLRFAGIDSQVALILGGALALSSSSVVLQMLTERGTLSSALGRAALSILLLQDLAVVPLITMLPVLAGAEANVATVMGSALARSLIVLACVVGAGRLVLRPVLRATARGKDPELFTGIALLLVLGIGWITQAAGLSMALGAFLAGLLIAETEYRPQVLADIAPFRGLLLALFFMTVGMGIDLELLVSSFEVILLLVLALVGVKVAVLTVLCLGFRMSIGASLHLGLLLAQGGEFAFLLFRMAFQRGVLPGQIEQTALLVVAISMVLTPLLAVAGRRVEGFLTTRSAQPLEISDAASELTGHIVIAGYGRVGQTLGAILDAEGAPFVALELDPGVVETARLEQKRVYFGDASRIEVLRAAGVGRATVAVVTLSDPRAAERAVRALHTAYPQLPIVARAHDLVQRELLLRAGAAEVIPEIVEGSFQIGAAVLRLMGESAEQIDLTLASFRQAP